MSDKDTSAIDQKKIDNNQDETSQKNDWGAFASSTFSNVVFTMIIGLIGANFIFFTTIDNLNKFFSTERVPDYFPQYVHLLKQTKGGGYTCKKEAQSFNFDSLKKIGIGGVGGWPYSMASNTRSGYFQSFKNWFADSIADTFIMSRGILKQWLGYFKEGTPLSNETLQMFFIGPFNLFMGMFASMAFGFFGYLYKSFEDGWGWMLIGLLFGYTMFFAFMTSIVHFFKFIGTFLIVPLISNLGLLGEILKCNSNSLALLFGALTVSSASTTLDSSISTSMMVVYIILLIKTIFF
jgi:hypothetical protein